MTFQRSDATPWTGENSPSTEQALKAKVCKCERPVPIDDEDLGRYCFRCSKALPKKRRA